MAMHPTPMLRIRGGGDVAAGTSSAAAPPTAADSRPEVGGSFWGFVGLMIAIGLVVVAIGAGVWFLLRYRLRRRAIHGSGLNVAHPSPARGRGWANLDERDDLSDEGDAFASTTPRTAPRASEAYDEPPYEGYGDAYADGGYGNAGRASGAYGAWTQDEDDKTPPTRA